MRPNVAFGALDAPNATLGAPPMPPPPPSTEALRAAVPMPRNQRHIGAFGPMRKPLTNWPGAFLWYGSEIFVGAVARHLAGDHEDHPLRDRHRVVGVALVEAAEEGDVDRRGHAVRPFAVHDDREQVAVDVVHLIVFGLDRLRRFD